MSLLGQVWTFDAKTDTYRCNRHAHEFGKLETCPDCDRAPVERAIDDIDAPPTTPDGCRSTLELERQFVRVSDMALSTVHDLARKERKHQLTVREHGAIVKYLDLAIKALSRAADQASRREDEETVKRRERRLRELAQMELRH